MTAVKTVAGLLAMLLNLLPASPVAGFVEEITGLNYLGYLNWFIPVSFMVKCMETWLGCMVAWNVYKHVRRIANKMF